MKALADGQSARIPPSMAVDRPKPRARRALSGHVRLEWLKVFL
jgi:hypothetical protein